MQLYCRNLGLFLVRNTWFKCLTSLSIIYLVTTVGAYRVSREYPVFHLNLAIGTERGIVLRNIDLGEGLDIPSSPNLLLPTTTSCSHVILPMLGRHPPILSLVLGRKILSHSVLVVVEQYPPLPHCNYHT